MSNRDLELLYEVGAFRWVRRTWEQFFGQDAASNAEHSYRVMWTALIIARMEKDQGAVINEEKLLKMALLHDLPESRVGDANYLTRQYMARDEDKAARDIFHDTVLKKEFLVLWKEYKGHKTLEAKIAKDADILDIDFELAEMQATGNTISKHFKPHRQLNYQKLLYTESAKQLWEQIQKSNPFDWHLRGRNRFNKGDWTKHRKKK